MFQLISNLLGGLGMFLLGTTLLRFTSGRSPRLPPACRMGVPSLGITTPGGGIEGGASRIVSLKKWPGRHFADVDFS